MLKKSSHFIYDYWILLLPFLILYLKNTLPKLTADILTKKYELDKKLINDKVLENLKAELSKENVKHSIEYSEIQEYKVKRINDFLDYFSEYLIDDVKNKFYKKEIEKLKLENKTQDESTKNQVKTENKHDKKFELKIEMLKLANTLILFASDETVKKYSDFRKSATMREKEKLKELQEFIKMNNETIDPNEKIKNLISMMEMQKILKKETEERLIEDYADFIIALRKDIGYKNTELEKNDYKDLLNNL